LYSGAAKQVESFFQQFGYSMPSHYNPADYIIDISCEMDDEKIKKISSTNLYENNNSKHLSSTSTLSSNQPIQYNNHDNIINDYKTVNEKNDYYNEQLNNQSQSEQQSLLLSKNQNQEKSMHERKMEPYATSFISQLFVLSNRSFKNFYRNFYLMPAHYISAIVMGVLLGIIYYQLGNDIAACQNRMGSIFFMGTLLNFAAMSSLELFLSERTTYVREVANGYYYPFAYFLSKSMFDLVPLRVIPPILMGSIAYWMIGLRELASHFAWFILLLIIINIVSGALCICIGSIASSVASANLMATTIILLNLLFAGFLLNKGSIPYYLKWVHYLAYFNYAYEALLINELYGFDIIIDPKGFPPTPGTGNFFLLELGMDYQDFYFDCVITTLFAIGHFVLAGILLTCFVREKR
jgi:ABC-type multidrug transport system permease subunit